MAAKPTFTVDTHLFRELGELLVGRDSTALVELIKNSYDADASRVVVHGENLEQPEHGRILIRDDGVGMSPEQFVRGFLTIAGRTKELGERRSVRYGRRYTGEKGIGRLAAHKLARELTVRTIPWSPDDEQRQRGVRAIIDWDVIEDLDTLDKAAKGIAVTTFRPRRNTHAGTTVALGRLRRGWTTNELETFLAEAQTFEPPPALVKRLPRERVARPLLFSAPNVRDGRKEDPGFSVHLSGAFEEPGDNWETLLESAIWVIEIRARRDAKVQYAIAPTERTRRAYPDARTTRFRIAHPDAANGPFFDARILVRGRREGEEEFRRWVRRTTGIRVYLEGFRVVPYGEPRNDWLSLDADYTARVRTVKSLQGLPGLEEDSDSEAGLTVLPNDNYVGAVFLTERGSPELRTLVNREGFVPNESYEHLVRLVRIGVDLSTRSRAAATELKRRADRERRTTRNAGAQTGADLENGAPPTPPLAVERREALRASVARATELGAEARGQTLKGDTRAAAQTIDALEKQIAALDAAVTDFISEQALLPVLASVGIQMARFVHEVNALLALTRSVESALGRIRSDEDLPVATRRVLAAVLGNVTDLRHRLERQATYLVDVGSSGARRRRSRQRFAERFDSAVELVEFAAAEQEVEISNRIPADLRSPPMFPAEITAIFTNLVTNAVKAAGGGGKIRASGEEADGRVRVVIENTGAAVDPEKGERWFRPFESTTEVVDPVLGQGLGLGLPITRALLEEYGGQLRFARPSASFATAVEIVI